MQYVITRVGLGQATPRYVIRGFVVLTLSVGLASTSFATMIEYVATASTSDFAVDANKLPISATTTFFDIGSNPDLSNTAQHEVGHALGFTVAYELFANNVSLLGGGPNRQYKDKDDSTVLAHLTPAASGTHMLVGVTVDGNNQTNDIMRPDQVVGQTWGTQDTKLLQDAFDWQTKDIALNIVFSGPFTMAQKTTITNAANAVQNALGTGAGAHTFTWTVVTVPEPGSAVLMITAMAFVVLAARRARR